MGNSILSLQLNFILMEKKKEEKKKESSEKVGNHGKPYTRRHDGLVLVFWKITSLLE